MNSTTDSTIDRTFASLAILKVNADKGKDYIQNFVPFVVEAARLNGSEVIATEDVRAKVESEFGLRIPLNPLKTILGRAAADGKIGRQAGVFCLLPDTDDYDIIVRREDFLRQYAGLVTKLIKFVSDRYDTSWTVEAADAALLAYLDRNSMPVLAATVSGSPVVSAPATSQDAYFLVNAFIQHLSQVDYEGFNLLETVVKGRMLADVLLYENLGGVSKPFENVAIYFDTPFVIRALGCSGTNVQAPCLELTQMLSRYNARLYIFEHTLAETEGILERNLRLLREGGLDLLSCRGESLEYFVREDYRPSDIEDILLSLRVTLNRMNIHIKRAPPVTEQMELGVDEMKLRRILQEEVGYWDPVGKQIDRDVDSVTAVHRLRQGNIEHQLETCGSLFVTSNTSLARASHMFFGDEYGRSKAPHCMLDFVLATLVWLKDPLSVSSDLPRKRIIADCYSAMNPSDKLWRMYVEEAERLKKRAAVTDSEWHVLLASRRQLMDITHGNESAFADGTAAEVLKRARQELRREEQERLQEEHTRQQKRQQDEHAAQQQTLLDQQAKIQEDLDRVADRDREKQRRLDEHEAEEQAKNERIQRRSRRSARGLSRAFVFVVVIAILIECFHTLHLPSTHHASVGEQILVGAVIVAAVAGVVHLALAVCEWGRKSEAWLASLIEKQLRAFKEW